MFNAKIFPFSGVFPVRCPFEETVPLIDNRPFQIFEDTTCLIYDLIDIVISYCQLELEVFEDDRYFQTIKEYSIFGRIVFITEKYYNFDESTSFIRRYYIDYYNKNKYLSFGSKISFDNRYHFEVETPQGSMEQSYTLKNNKRTYHYLDVSRYKTYNRGNIYPLEVLRRKYNDILHIDNDINPGGFYDDPSETLDNPLEYYDKYWGFGQTFHRSHFKLSHMCSAFVSIDEWSNDKLKRAEHTVRNLRIRNINFISTPEDMEGWEGNYDHFKGENQVRSSRLNARFQWRRYSIS